MWKEKYNGVMMVVGKRKHCMAEGEINYCSNNYYISKGVSKFIEVIYMIGEQFRLAIKE